MHELFPPIQIYIILGISVTLSSIWVAIFRKESTPKIAKLKVASLFVLYAFSVVHILISIGHTFFISPKPLSSWEVFNLIFHVIVVVMVILFIKQIISELNQKKSQRISVLNPEEKRPG